MGRVNVVQCLVEAGANLEAVDKVSGHVVWEYVDVWHGNWCSMDTQHWCELPGMVVWMWCNAWWRQKRTSRQLTRWVNFYACWNISVHTTSSLLYSNPSLTILQWSGGTISHGSGKASSHYSRGSKVCSAQHSICAQVMASSSVNKTQCVARSIYSSQFTIIHPFMHSFVCMCINTVFIRRSVCRSFELTVYDTNHLPVRK